jgi:hypothetical protein
MFLGIYTEYIASCGDTRVTLRSTGQRDLSENRSVWATVDPTHISIFTAETDND